MDFQSAARFGERRVMVTDYDETAVKVNAKVVDEDTGAVICESGGGGGGEITTVTVTVVRSDNISPQALINLKGLFISPEDDVLVNEIVLKSDNYNNFKALFYKNSDEIMTATYYNCNVTVTGNANIDGNNDITYSGDFTITISPVHQ